MAKATFKRIFVAVGEYQDKNGQTRNRWTQIGTVFFAIDDPDKISLKVDTIPVGWNGHAIVRDDQSKKYKSGGGAKLAEPEAYDDEINIPF